MTKPAKRLQVGGMAEAKVVGDALMIAPSGGLVVVTVIDLDGTVVWMHHPLSGWYVEMDMRGNRQEDRPL